MTESARPALSEEAVTALRESYLERFAHGDDNALYEFFDLRGIDLRPHPDDEVIHQPAAGSSP